MQCLRGRTGLRPASRVEDQYPAGDVPPTGIVDGMSEDVEIQTWGKRFSDAIGDKPDVHDIWAHRVRQALDDWVRENNQQYPYTVAEAVALARAFRARRAELRTKTSVALEKALTEGLTQEDVEKLEADLRSRYKLEDKDE